MLQAKWRVTLLTCQKQKFHADGAHRPPSHVCIVVHAGSLHDLSKHLWPPVWKSTALPNRGPKERWTGWCDAHNAAMFVLCFQLAANQNASGDAADPSEHVLAHLHHSRGIIYKNKLPFIVWEWEEMKQRDGVGWDASKSRKQFISHLHYKDPPLLPTAGAASQLQLTWDM